MRRDARAGAAPDGESGARLPARRQDRPDRARLGRRRRRARRRDLAARVLRRRLRAEAARSYHGTPSHAIARRGRDRRRHALRRRADVQRRARRHRRRAHPARRHQPGRAASSCRSIRRTRSGSRSRSRSPRPACAPTGSTPTTPRARATRRGTRCGSRRRTIVDDGWAAEMAIPLSQLRLPREPATSWGINFNWYIPHRNEDVFWRAVPPDRTAWASWFGELTALPPVRRGLGLELMPYVATRTGSSTRSRPARRRSTSTGLRGRARREAAPAARASSSRRRSTRTSARSTPIPRSSTSPRTRCCCPRSGRSSSRTTRCSPNAGGNVLLQPAHRRAAARRAPPCPTYDRSTPARRSASSARVAAGGYVAPRTQIAALARGHRRDRAPTRSPAARRARSSSRRSPRGPPRASSSSSARRCSARPRPAVERSLDGTGLAPLLREDRARRRRADAQAAHRRRHLRAATRTAASTDALRHRRGDHGDRGELGALLPAPRRDRSCTSTPTRRG